MKKIGLALGFALAACGELPHDGAFDPASPPEKQAKSVLSGAVSLEGEPDASGVAVELQAEARTYTVQTGADGAFRLAGVVPGLYDVTYKTRYFVAQTDTVSVPLGTEVALPARRLVARRASVTGNALVERLVNRALEQAGGAEILFTKTGSIRGAAAAAPAAWRAAAEVDTFSLTTLAGEDGSFTLNGVPAGVYRLVIKGPGGEGAEVEGLAVTGEEPTVTLEPVVVKAVTGYFEIVGDAGGAESNAYTNTPVVTLRLDGFNAVAMRVGTSASGAAGDCALGANQPYVAEIDYTLPAEGEVTVCVQYVGEDGRVTEVLTDTIVYDGSAPFGTVLAVNGGADFVTAQGGGVTLSLTAFDGVTRLDKMRVANLAAGACGAALDAAVDEPFVTVKTWLLANPANAAAGFRTVCARFADAAGNWSAPVSDTVYFDPVLYAPGFAAVVRGAEGRADRTKSAKVTVELAFSGAATDVTHVLVGNDASFAGVAWRAFTPNVPWTLEPGDALKTVYVKVRDFAGNESARLQPQITLDQSGPETPVLALNDVNGDSFPLSSTTVELRWTTPSAPDLAGFEIERYVEGYDAQFGLVASPGPAANTLVNGVAATAGYIHHYRIRAQDDLGNVSAYSTVLTARPFTPVSSLTQLRGAFEARYFLQPLPGTFLVSTDWLYENPFPGDAFRDQLGFNVLDWSRAASFNGFNDTFVIRTSNVDNTLVYESTFAPAHDTRGFGGQSLGSGASPHLGVQSNGTVNIIYSNSGIFAASNAGGTWASTARYATIMVGGPRAAFAPNGDVFMPYQLSAAFGPIPVDVRTGGVWSSATHPDTNLFNPNVQAVRADASGNAYHVYGDGYDNNASASQLGVRAVRRSAAGAWSAILNFDAGTAKATSLSAARGSDRFCFAYELEYATPLYYLRYACRTDAGGTVLPATLFSGTNISATAIGLKSNNQYVIAYVETTTRDLKVWDQTSGATVTVHGDAAEPVMVIDASNTVHLAFREAVNQDLMYYHNASGTWAGRTVASQGGQGYAPSIAAGPDGRIHIAYGDQLNGQLGYVVLEAPIAKRVASGVEGLDAKIDAAGAVHAAYRLASNDSLYYGRWNGASFTSTLLDADMSLTYAPSIALDGAGAAHVVYANEAENQIRYATNASGSWVVQQAGTLATFTAWSAPRLVVSGGVVHVLASGRYLKRSGGVWTNETITGAEQGPGDIAVAADGRVHTVAYPFAFVDIGTLKHHVRGLAGGWTAGYTDTAWYGAPRMVATADGQVHIAAEKNGDAVLVSILGSAYTRRTIESSNDVGQGVDFAFDADGALHFVYGDNTNGSIRYATDRLTRGIESIELAKSANLDEISIAFDPAGAPVAVFGNGDVVIVEDFLRDLPAQSVVRTTAY